MFHTQAVGLTGAASLELPGSRGAFAIVLQPCTVAQPKWLQMAQVMCCVLDLSNKGFISISPACWIYKTYFLSLPVLQWIKLATVYSLQVVA